MTNTPVSESLKTVLANSYALYLKTQNYHWNVTGQNFKTLHDLFEEQYTDLATAIDEIAERIRSLGEKAPGTFSAYDKLSNIQSGNENADAKTMVQDLAESQNIMIQSLNESLKVAQTADDEVTIGLLIDRMTVHEKNTWMLNSSL
jgi:starvation-inducible DNA-binding protein